MRTRWFFVTGILVLAVAASGPLTAQQPAAPPAPPSGLAGGVPLTTPPVPYSDAVATEKNFVVGVLPPFSWGPIETPKPRVPDGFTPIFNGVNLVGWHPSRTNIHGTAPDFFVLNGTIVGTQNPLGQGGILLTDKSYHNFEWYMEVRPDYGCDSGVFFRSTEAGHAYQVTMDYLPGGSMGSLILEGISSGNRAAGAGGAGAPGAAAPTAGRTGAPGAAAPTTGRTGAPGAAPAANAPAAAGAARAGGAAGGGRGGPPVVGGIPLGSTSANGEAAWMKAWKHEAWNTVRIRVEGDMPHVQVWINDSLVTDTQETTNRAEGGIVSGPIAIQMHGGTRWVQDGFWRWRNIGIKELP